MLTRLDVPCRPFRNLSRPDRQERWRVRADGDGPIFDASAIAMGRRLEAQAVSFRSAPNVPFQPKGHVRRQRRLAV